MSTKKRDSRSPDDHELGVVPALLIRTRRVIAVAMA